MAISGINFLTRPVGYDTGGDVKPASELDQDKVEEKKEKRKKQIKTVQGSRAAGMTADEVKAAAERGDFPGVEPSRVRGPLDLDEDMNQDTGPSFFEKALNTAGVYLTTPGLSGPGTMIDLLGRTGAATAPYTENFLKTISQGGDSFIAKAGQFLFEDAANVAAKINAGTSFDELTPFEKLAIASVPAEFIPGVGLAPDIFKLGRNFVINLGDDAAKLLDNYMVSKQAVTDTGIMMPIDDKPARVRGPSDLEGITSLRVGDETSSVGSKSDETKKVYPNLKYKTAADDFIKANYKKMSDQQMLDEMMKDPDKYFYEPPSSVKSLEQRRLDSLKLSRGASAGSAMRYGSELDYENVIKEFDTMTKDMDLSKMSKEEIYRFFEDAYKSATGLEPLTTGNTKKLFLTKLDRFTNEKGLEKIRKSEFEKVKTPNPASLFKTTLSKNETINEIVADKTLNADKGSIFRYLNFIRESSPSGAKPVEGKFDNFFNDFKLEISDLKNTDSAFYKQYQYFKDYDKVRDTVTKKVKPVLDIIFPAKSADEKARNSVQIAHRFRNTQIGKTVPEGLAGTGGTPSAYYLDISKFNSEIQGKLERKAVKAIEKGDTKAIQEIDTELKKIGAEVNINGVKLGEHKFIEEKLNDLIMPYITSPKLAEEAGITPEMIKNYEEALEILNKEAQNIGKKYNITLPAMAEGGIASMEYMTRPLDGQR